MTTHNTRSPLGTPDPKDLYDNSENPDQFINNDVKAEEVAAPPADSVVIIDDSPAILTLSDAQNAVCASVDDFGGLNLPGIPLSVQDMLRQHESSIRRLSTTGQVLDIRDNGFKPGSKNDARGAIQQAVDKLASAGGGVLYLPPGEYLLGGPVMMASGVSIVGAGIGKTVLLPTGSTAALRYAGSAARYLENLVLTDFTVNGELQVNPASGFVPDSKGTFFQFWRNVAMDRLAFLNTGATSIGNDMPDNCSILRCYVENAGRLAQDREAPIHARPLGCSGIGLGTGAKDDEPIFVAFNTAKNCANFGLFFEPQAGGAARGAVVVGNVLEGNYAGLADCGVDGLQVMSNQCRRNTFGILRYPGTNNSGKPGRRGQYIGNLIEDSTQHGIYSFLPQAKNDPLEGGSLFSGNIIRRSGRDGINFRYQNAAVGILNEMIADNLISENGRHGIYVEQGKEVVNTDITGNKIWNNGKEIAGDAVHIIPPVRMSSITGNKIRDTQDVPTQQYPVAATGAMTDVDISFNHCVGNAKNTLNLTGTNTRVTTTNNAGVNS